MDAIAGHEGRLTAGSINISMDRWQCRSTATKVPANTFENRHRYNKGGLIGTEVSFSGYHDRDNPPFNAAGGGLKAGATIACSAYLIKGGAAFLFTSITIFEVSEENEVDGRVSISVSGETNGSWTYPGGEASLP